MKINPSFGPTSAGVIKCLDLLPVTCCLEGGRQDLTKPSFFSSVYPLFLLRLLCGVQLSESRVLQEPSELHKSLRMVQHFPQSFPFFSRSGSSAGGLYFDLFRIEYAPWASSPVS